MELSPAVDVPVTVNIVWTGPAGVTLSNTPTMMNSLSVYTSTAEIGSFRRNDSGNYTCIANVNPTSSFNWSRLNTTELTVGMGPINVWVLYVLNHLSLNLYRGLPHSWRIRSC